MALSTVTVTGAWVTAANTPATGQVTIAPVAVAVGAGTIVAGVPVSARLVAGAISVVVVANTQATTLQYRVSEQIDGAANTPDYFITPSGSTLDLSTAPRGTGTAVPLYVLASVLGQPNGVPTLDGTGKVPLAQLPTSATGVLDVAPADATIVVAGTAQHPTVGVGVISESKVTNLTADLAAINSTAAGKASKLVVRRAYITTGDVTLPNTSSAWQRLFQVGGASFEIAIPAAVGDDVQIGVHAMRSATSGASVDIAVIVGTTLQRFLATGTSTPAVEGDPGWYPSNSFIGQSAPRGFTVAAGDLDTGTVRFVVAAKSGGTGTLYASTSYPFYWQAENRGPVS
jgi:hypothetical protein